MTAETQPRTHLRTVNGGTPELITTREALAEMNACQMDKAIKRTVREMSASGSSANIRYRDGRKVDIRPATPEEITALTTPATPEEITKPETTANRRRIVTVKGKRYVVEAFVPARSYVWYWSERDGKPFGSTRNASASDKPGTVGAAIWAAANR